MLASARSVRSSRTTISPSASAHSKATDDKTNHEIEVVNFLRDLGDVLGHGLVVGRAGGHGD